MHIIPIRTADIAKASETLFRAFENDALLLWLFGGKDNYHQKALKPFQTWTKWCVDYGMAFATDNLAAVTLWKKPGNHRFTLWQLLRTGMLLTPCALDSAIRKRVLLFENFIKTEYLKLVGGDQFCYCWLLGTDDNFRKQGFAKLLMDHVFNLVETTHLPLFLETSKQENVIFYEKLGFKVLLQKQFLDSEVVLNFMARR